ncbi:MAG: hypothetical protein CHACPFDD_03324 [Phycisphaerae bacterium]|nr:hypothetical protein [Phycisphaerae bacterium]
MQAGFLDLLLRHNLWATGVLLDDAARLAPEQFHRHFEIGPGSIHDTLRHIIGAALRWSDRISGRPLRESIDKRPEPFGVSELQQRLEQSDKDLRRAAGEVAARGAWGETMEFAVPDGLTYRFSRAAAMMHVVTHGVHHRAQVLNMRRQLGLPLLELDLIECECRRTGQIPPKAP